MRWIIWIVRGDRDRRDRRRHRRLQPAEGALRVADGARWRCRPTPCTRCWPTSTLSVVAARREVAAAACRIATAGPPGPRTSSGMKIPLYFERWSARRCWSSRIADPALPFGGTWTYRIAPAPGGSDAHDHRRRRSLQPVLPLHVALRLRHHATLDEFIKNLRAGRVRAHVMTKTPSARSSSAREAGSRSSA